MTGQGSPGAQGILPEDWGDWDRPLRGEANRSNAPVVEVAGFEGPLDWLLEQVRAGRIDLSRLSILALVEAFTAALEAGLGQQGADIRALGQWADWLVMAATLTQLRSALLLPATDAQARQALDDAESLRRRVRVRGEMAGAVDWLEARPQLGRDVHRRGMPDKDLARRANRGAGLIDLLRACLVALALPKEEAVYLPAPPSPYTMRDAVARLRRLLPEHDGAPLESFMPRIAPDADRERHARQVVTATLAAALELARDGVLLLEQEYPCAPIRVRQAGQLTDEINVM